MCSQPEGGAQKGVCLLAVRGEGFYTVSDMEKLKIHERGEQLMKLTFWEGSGNRGRGLLLPLWQFPCNI